MIVVVIERTRVARVEEKRVGINNTHTHTTPGLISGAARRKNKIFKNIRARKGASDENEKKKKNGNGRRRCLKGETTADSVAYASSAITSDQEGTRGRNIIMGFYVRRRCLRSR